MWPLPRPRGVHVISAFSIGSSPSRPHPGTAGLPPPAGAISGVPCLSRGTPGTYKTRSPSGASPDPRAAGAPSGTRLRSRPSSTPPGQSRRRPGRTAHRVGRQPRHRVGRRRGGLCPHRPRHGGDLRGRTDRGCSRGPLSGPAAWREADTGEEALASSLCRAGDRGGGTHARPPGLLQVVSSSKAEGIEDPRQWPALGPAARRNGRPRRPVVALELLVAARPSTCASPSWARAPGRALRLVRELAGTARGQARPQSWSHSSVRSGRAASPRPPSPANGRLALAPGSYAAALAVVPARTAGGASSQRIHRRAQAAYRCAPGP